MREEKVQPSTEYTESTNRCQQPLIEHVTYKSVVLAVILSDVGEEHRLGGHVEAHGESFGGKENLDQTLAEQNLYSLLHDWQHT